MLDRLRDRQPLRAGLQRAALHFARAGYEVVSGVGAIVEEVVAAVRDEDADGDDRGPEKIDVQ